jgi:phage shock protein A
MKIRMSSEVRDWLTALLAADRQMGRLVGEAVTVLFSDPPVTALADVLRAEEPAIALDRTYQCLLESLQKVRRSVAELATERKRAELRGTGLGPRHRELEAEEEQAAISAQRYQARVDLLRTRKETLKAAYTAAFAKQEIDEAFVTLGEPPPEVADDMAAARTGIDEFLREAASMGADAFEGLNALYELRLSTADLRLLFAAGIPGVAVPLVVGIDRDDWRQWYEDALSLAHDELRRPDDDFTDYDLAGFLAAYFPGEEAEVRASAARLLELNRS